jgi:hypothetical protein
MEHLMERTIAVVRNRARQLARGADEQLTGMTGRPLTGWAATATARAVLRDHPLPALVVTLGAGYVVGKLLRR